MSNGGNPIILHMTLGQELNPKTGITMSELLDLLANYVVKVSGKELSSNDFTDALKDKLDGIPDDLELTFYTQTAVDDLLDDKVDKESGKGLSTNDFTDLLKDKLDGIEEEANANFIVFARNEDLTPEQIAAGERRAMLFITSGDVQFPIYLKPVINELLDEKVDKETGKGLSTNDFTDAYKETLDNFTPSTPAVASPVKKIEIKTRTSSGNLFGDANGDGKVTTADQILVDRYIEDDTTVLNDLVAADVNFDGVIDQSDLDSIVACASNTGLLSEYIIAKCTITFQDNTTQVVPINVPPFFDAQKMQAALDEASQSVLDQVAQDYFDKQEILDLLGQI